jgi:large subunit ribosomal protein L15
VKLHDLRPAAGSRKSRTRVGRGIAAGQGKTAGRGTKGQKARAGASIPAWFEGGQTPIHVRVPKLRGFRNAFKIEYQVVNVGRIAEYAAAGRFGVEVEGQTAAKSKKGSGAPVSVNPAALASAGLIGTDKKPVKILGQGDVGAPLFVAADAFTRVPGPRSRAPAASSSCWLRRCARTDGRQTCQEGRIRARGRTHGRCAGRAPKAEAKAPKAKAVKTEPEAPAAEPKPMTHRRRPRRPTRPRSPHREQPATTPKRRPTRPTNQPHPPRPLAAARRRGVVGGVPGPHQCFPRAGHPARILFVLGMLVVYRFLAVVPVPRVNHAAVADLVNSQAFLQLIDLFSGGGLSSFSVVAMGVNPTSTPRSSCS